MTSNLYEEAIADARKLREIAEQNAKNAIIESITPKIRDLIESQIIGEESSFDEDDIFEEVVSESSQDTEQEFDMTPEAAQELKSMLESSASEAEPEEQTVSAEESSIVSSASYIKECNEYIETVSEVLEKVRGTKPAELNEQDLQKYLALVAISDKAVEKLSEMVASAEGMQIFEGVIQNSQDQIQNFKKEIKEMKRSLRDLLSEEVITIELDLGDDAVVDSEEVSVKVKEEEELIDTDAEEEGDEEVEVEDVEVEEDMEVEELEEMILELEEDDMGEGMGHMYEEDDDMKEMGHRMDEEEDADEGYMYEEDDDAHEGHGHGMDMMEGLDDDTVLEIDENMLREELAKLMQESEFDAEEEVIEETAEPVATEQNDELQAEIESYQSAVADLQSQLAEMSLFNAKLLYTNKLLMNSDLSQGQRAQAIETLDDAASLREVKLLFKTLTESFSKRVEEKTSRNIGGASRPTKSASMNLNESTEANRWALLAGIK